MPEEFRHFTPAEFEIFFKARCSARNENLYALDTMNALLCTVIAACAGNKSKPEDFMTLKRQESPKVPVMGDSPETIRQKLELLTLSMGGTV